MHVRMMVRVLIVVSDTLVLEIREHQVYADGATTAVWSL